MSNAIERFLNKRQPNPFQDLSQMQDSFDRLFNELVNVKQAKGIKDFSFSPSCEVVEESGFYLMKFDLPGVKKEHVKIEINKDQLTVSAERQEEKSKEEKKKFFSEISYGAYSRTFTLPGPVDEKKVNAKFENGVLTISVPKTESLTSKQIQIN